MLTALGDYETDKVTEVLNEIDNWAAKYQRSSNQSS